jgi:peptidoglycan/xylan/chitin deacetylase (PgdA/CDA1 family)
MNIYFTLDYELFLGSATGSVYSCLIKPMELLCNIVDRYNIKFTIFADATYLLALKKNDNYSSTERDYKDVVSHLRLLQKKGHSIQLHIHPHWMYSEYNGKEWNVMPNHYKLSDIPIEEANGIIKKSKELLEEIIDDKVSVFRAGGFSIQPFELYAEIFENLGLRIDSSVLCSMYYDSDNQQYDYRNAPDKYYYRFNENVCMDAGADGVFEEYPISTHIISPLFWWRLSLLRILKIKGYHTFGDGKSVETTSQSIMSRLIKSQRGFACSDGYKSSLLFKMRDQQLKTFGQTANFVILGHPKLATPYSIKNLAKFIAKFVDIDTFQILK